jgi:hypothetical protein
VLKDNAMKTIVKHTGFFVAGMLVASTMVANAQLSGQVNVQPAAGYDPDAALKAEIAELKAQMAAAQTKLAGVENQAKTIAGKRLSAASRSFEAGGGL